MTTTEATLEMYSAMDDDTLLALWESDDSAEKQYARRKRMIEIVLERRMRDRNATVMPHPTLNITLASPKSPEYDHNILDELREYKSPVECLAARIPEKVIPAKWNMTKVKPWLAEGDHIRDIVKRATLPAKPATMTIEEKKK